MPKQKTVSDTQLFLLSIQLLGDIVVCFLGLALAYWLRFKTPLRGIGVEAFDIHLYRYFPLLGLGTLFFVGSFATLGLYDSALLLRPQRAFSIIMRGVFFWFLAFLGTSLVLKFDPPVSRIFVLLATITTLAALVLWRFGFYALLSRSRMRDELQQQVVILGWSDEASRLVDAIAQDQNHPYAVHGLITTPSSAAQVTRHPLHLGTLAELDQILRDHHIHIVVIADLDLTREQLMQIAAICERRYVDFKVIPSFFQVFVSNLRMQTISGVPLLGIEKLPLNSLPNQLVKRLVDVIGAMVGMMLSLPIILVLAWLVRRESPGPIFYKQVRSGLRGQPFTIYKLRSMKVDAERGTGPQWAVANDPRRLKVGAFMREWNLDELPQFWNILSGDMSLVGPRPERPELIRQFEHEIAHYNPRHSVRPGLTGWAQVNGLRGNTSLTERIRYDLYYIENWSVWFDVQIMLLTFFRRKNAY